MTNNEAIPLYREGRHYDLLNADVVADIPFYLEEARRAGGPVLELACGTGRLTIPIAQTGVEVVGLDQSASMLAHLRTKARQAVTSRGLAQYAMPAGRLKSNLGSKSSFAVE